VLAILALTAVARPWQRVWVKPTSKVGVLRLESGTNAPLVFSGVAGVGQAAPILEQAAGAGARS